MSQSPRENSAINNWLASVAEAGRELLQRGPGIFNRKVGDYEQLAQLCEELVSTKGEALGTALAYEAVAILNHLQPEDDVRFFQLLVEAFSTSREQVELAISEYRDNPSVRNLHSLHRVSESPRQELFRRINISPGGTAALVKMRERLLPLLADVPDFEAVDADLRHLMTSWFNRGFLQLRRIDWSSPASLLEKLMTYEAVHSVAGWEDLRRRLAFDRRCFGFFHPALENEPLIFVQVALTTGLASSVQALLNGEVDVTAQETADTAIFYSISDCQKGLRGISFGNFLIKQVLMDVRAELPDLQRFATLSPIPGFCRWLDQELPEEWLDQATLASCRAACAKGSWPDIELHKSALLSLCAKYLYSAKDGQYPLDPVARFHLRNGARIDRLNWAGDTSAKGIRQSAGIMVNYSYDLSQVEERHENYLNKMIVATGRDFEKTLNAKISPPRP
ncbi:MAG: malonyl-CoA decarboxylase [Parahaliea sp.]